MNGGCSQTEVRQHTKPDLKGISQNAICLEPHFDTFNSILLIRESEKLAIMKVRYIILIIKISRKTMSPPKVNKE